MSKRIRIGLIVPSTNSTAEADFNLVAPDNVTVHGQRVWLRNEDLSGEGMDRMNEEVEQAALYLGSAKVDYIIYACTTGSFYKGPGYDRQIIEDIERVAGVPATATAVACVEALNHFAIKRLSVVSPYNEWQNGRLETYLNASGFVVLNVSGDPAGAVAGAQGHNDLSPKSALAFSENKCLVEAEGMLCSCTAWRTLEIVSELENRLNKPVVTANQATIWMAFLALGVQPRRGFGSLLDSISRSTMDGTEAKIQSVCK